MLRNEKGSTLLLVLITVAVLTVLGVTLMSMSFMNYNMKYTDAMMKQTLYYSESGIEQAYAIVGKYVDDAIIGASDKTKKKMDDMEETIVSFLDAVDAEVEKIKASPALQEDYTKWYNTNIASTEVTVETFLSNKYYYIAILSKNRADEATGSVKYEEYENYCIGVYPSGEDFVEDVLSTKSDSSDEKLNELRENKVYQIGVDYEALKDLTQTEFNKLYREEFNDNETNMEADIRALSTGDGYDTDYGDNTRNINLSEVSKFKTGEGSNADDVFIIKDLTSSFTYKDKTKVTIKTDITIGQPKKALPIEFEQNVFEIKDNPLRKYAIVTQNDFYIFGSKDSEETSETIINGNIYMKGNNPSEDDLNKLRDSSNYRGLVLAGKTNTTILGDVVTNSYVQINNLNKFSTEEGFTSGAELSVRNGMVYCNGLVIQEGASNSKITVDNGNVYCRDDLELYGSKNTIEIKGSYYGFMNTAKEFNKTSSIIFNADQETSTIKISGEELTDPKKKEENTGVYILGAAWINDTFYPNPQDESASGLYQTGESVGIKRNYLAYAQALTSEPFTASDMDATIGDNSGLALYYKLKNTSSDDSDSEKSKYFNNNGIMTLEGKKAYFEEVLKDNKGLISLGDKSLGDKEHKFIDIKNYQYTAGIAFRNPGEGTDEKNVLWKNADSDKRIDTENRLVRDYVYIMNYLRYRDDSSNDSMWDKKSNPEAVSYSDTATVVWNYSKLMNKDYKTKSMQEVDSGESKPGEKATQVAIVLTKSSDSDAANILIAGKNSEYYSKEKVSLNVFDGDEKKTKEEFTVVKIGAEASYMEGMILTDGRVYIDGDLDFYGSIVAVKDICINISKTPGCEVNLTNNRLAVQKMLNKLVHNNEELEDALAVNSENNEGTPNKVTIKLETIKITDTVQVDSGDNNNIRNNYDKLITFSNWRKTND